MATRVGEAYLCEVCGNKVRVLESGDGELVCCGEPMKALGDEFQPSPATPSGP
jgi:superoxide reductase